MGKRKLQMILATALLGCLVFPAAAIALPSVSIDPSAGVTTFPGHPFVNPEHGAFVSAWQTPVTGTDYTVTFSDAANYNQILVSVGDVQSVNFGADTVTAVIKSIELYDPNSENHTPGLMAAAVKPPQGGSGPPPQSQGMYISTNAYQWDILPGGQDDHGKPTYFEIRVTGRTGIPGWFKWYWPQALLDLMEIDADDLAGYVDGDLVSVNSEAVPGGGALITLRLTYSTHVIRTARALPLSLARSRTRVRRKNNVSLFGWTKPGLVHKRVALYRRYASRKTYARLGSTVTNVNGKYYLRIPVGASAYYKTKAVINGQVKWSPAKLVRVY